MILKPDIIRRHKVVHSILYEQGSEKKPIPFLMNKEENKNKEGDPIKFSYFIRYLH